MRCLAALLLAGACGRIDFDDTGGTGRLFEDGFEGALAPSSTVYVDAVVADTEPIGCL